VDRFVYRPFKKIEKEKDGYIVLIIDSGYCINYQNIGLTLGTGEDMVSFSVFDLCLAFWNQGGLLLLSLKESGKYA